VYCFMYNVTDADLVQVLRKRRSVLADGKGNEKEGDKTQDNKSPATSAAVSTSNVNSKDDCLQEQQKEESNSPASRTNNNCKNNEENRSNNNEDEKSDTQLSPCAEITKSAQLELPCASSVKDDEPRDCAVKQHSCTSNPPHEVCSVEIDEKEKVVVDSNVVCTTQQAIAERSVVSLAPPPPPVNDKMETIVTDDIITDDAKPPPSLTMISASRISLDDPLWRHGMQWDQVILPRLCSFVQAVYEIRRNDDKRYRLLLAVSSPPLMTEEQEGGSSSSSNLLSSTRDGWKVLFDECPWLLRDCSGTAYHRNYM
jgi:hypothetical protein